MQRCSCLNRDGWGLTGAMALVALIPVLGGEPQASAFANLHRIQNQAKTAATIIEVAPALSPQLFDKALSCLDSFTDEKIRVQVIEGLAPDLPEEYFPQILKVARSIQEKDLRALALAALVKKWLLLPVPQSLSLWKETIHDLSNRSRSDFLSDLKSLSPLIYDLGGVSAIVDTLQAIKDVGRWWN
jgi:glutamine synthetase adenylyltransferase